MPNMTITADEEVLRRARVKAAEGNTSVAQSVGRSSEGADESRAGLRVREATIHGREAASAGQRAVSLPRPAP